MNLEWKDGDGLYVYIPKNELNFATAVVRTLTAKLRELGYREDSEQIEYCTEVCAYILKEYFDQNQVRSIQ